eukprot:GGOE01025523.1.p4 GENE.GGOE01025523.1~~GGOE01025523.1.p4  ORF type:complete len:191 (-),score=64.44 GGOE01025523.1:1623-2195(-)
MADRPQFMHVGQPFSAFWGGQVTGAGLVVEHIPEHLALCVTHACLDHTAPPGPVCLWFQLGRGPAHVLCTLSMATSVGAHLVFNFTGGAAKGRFHTTGVPATVHLSGYLLRISPEKDAEEFSGMEGILASMGEEEDEEEDEDFCPDAAEEAEDVAAEDDEEEEEEDEDFDPEAAAAAAAEEEEEEEEEAE